MPTEIHHATLTPSQMLELRIEGFSLQQIADIAGVTRQAVGLVLRPPLPVREQIYQRYNDQCSDCKLRVITRTSNGCIKNQSGHIHNSKGGDLDWDTLEDLVLLCNSCHKQQHKGH